VPPTDVAEWAGQSTEILFRIYAKCLDGGKELLRRRVDAALGHQAPPESWARIQHSYPWNAVASRTRPYTIEAPDRVSAVRDLDLAGRRLFGGRAPGGSGTAMEKAVYQHEWPVLVVDESVVLE
jgi:hypothetical protein